MSDLKERLRSMGLSMTNLAADEVQRLESEIESVKYERDKLKTELHETVGQDDLLIADLKSQLCGAMEENTDLRQQLEFKVSEGTKRLVDRCAKAEEENAELRQTLERLEDQHKKNQADLAGCILTHKADAEHIEKLERHCKELLEEKAELRREVSDLKLLRDSDADEKHEWVRELVLAVREIYAIAGEDKHVNEICNRILENSVYQGY